MPCEALTGSGRLRLDVAGTHEQIIGVIRRVRAAARACAVSSCTDRNVNRIVDIDSAVLGNTNVGTIDRRVEGDSDRVRRRARNVLGIVERLRCYAGVQSLSEVRITGVSNAVGE